MPASRKVSKNLTGLPIPQKARKGRPRSSSLTVGTILALNTGNGVEPTSLAPLLYQLRHVCSILRAENDDGVGHGELKRKSGAQRTEWKDTLATDACSSVHHGDAQIFLERSDSESRHP